MRSDGPDLDVFGDMLEGAAVAVLVVDRDLKLTFANQSARDLFGLGQDGWFAKPVVDLADDERRDLVERFFRRTIKHDHEQKLLIRRIRTG